MLGVVKKREEEIEVEVTGSPSGMPITDIMLYEAMLKHAKEDYRIQEYFLYTAGLQEFSLKYDLKDVTDVFVDEKRLTPAEYSISHNLVEVLTPLSGNEVIVIHYTHHCDFSQVYGIKRDKEIKSPDWERIGNLALHAELPIQTNIKRCLLLDDGTVNYFLHDYDSTKKADGTTAVLDGTDGQVMVRIPEHFQRFDEIDGIQYAWFSALPFPGATRIKTMYTSLAEANVHRPTNTLASVINMSPDYRGGRDNRPEWDGQPNTQLGRPATHLNRIDFKLYAQNRGAGWDMMQYEVRRVIAWMITLEYATFHHQKPFNPGLTIEGYKKGGLGDGPTTLVSAEWSTFSGYYPFMAIGQTLVFGNQTGEIPVMLNDFPTTGEVRTIMVNTYRGIENFFGNLFEWTDGINIEASQNGAFREIYKAIGSAHSNTDYVGYKKIGTMPPVSGYISKILFGKDGDILPIEATGASATTYLTDYYWMSTSVGIRGLLCSALANASRHAGSFVATTTTAPSNAIAHYASRLCFFER